MSLEDDFQRYFDAVGDGQDRCYLCRRSPKDVKRFFGFDEDGVPLKAAAHGLEEMDIMSYRGLRPVCAVCQLNIDAISALDEGDVFTEVIQQMQERRDDLWPGAPGS
ncbi:MAG: hypothetical protein ACPGPE_12005 [Planctomycetota bacterium]